jgi:hypothetical protein
MTGGVRCWGDNSSFQLGTTYRWTPACVIQISP